MRLHALLLAAPLAAGLAAVLPAAVAGQDQGVPMATVERQYRNMSPVHIAKCDHDRSGYFTRSEMLCVQNIYRTFYLSDR
jgi:hypothetical protein